MTLSYADRIRANHEKGTLLAHMFEFRTYGGRGFETEPHSNLPKQKCFENFFKVMHGDEGSEFKTSNHYYQGQTEGCPPGFTALATTSMKKGHAVRPWLDESHIGLLLDGSDAAHVNPVLVRSADSYSHAKGHNLVAEADDQFMRLRDIQQLDLHLIPETRTAPVSRILFDLCTDQEGRFGRARAALGAMWQEIEQRPQHMTKRKHSLNEISTQAQLKGIIGIMVCEDPFCSTKQQPHTLQSDYAQYVADAAQLRDWLHEKYHNIFPEKLPIMSYSRHRTENQFIELSKEQIQNPQLPQSHIAATAQTEPYGRGR